MSVLEVGPQEHTDPYHYSMGFILLHLVGGEGGLEEGRVLLDLLQVVLQLDQRQQRLRTDLPHKVGCVLAVPSNQFYILLDEELLGLPLALDLLELLVFGVLEAGDQPGDEEEDAEDDQIRLLLVFLALDLALALAELFEEVLTELVVPPEEVPGGEALLLREVLLLHVQRVQQPLGQRRERHQRRVPYGPVVRTERLHRQNHRLGDEFLDVMLQQGVLEDVPHDVERVHLDVILLGGGGLVQKEGKGLVQQDRLVLGGLCPQDRQDRRRDPCRPPQDGADVLYLDVV
mmetsp:Transcript_4629/g.4344  ORF Transcript_4629/g.4344 Transcript_4629/m.4344 type:complete len:288 (+) Transcript_4629:329-1192(+)